MSGERRGGAGRERLDARVLVMAGVVVLGGLMSILDTTVVNVALETFQREFDATSAQVAWTMTAYTLALAAVIPLTGWAADRFGTRRLYLLAIVLFTLGSALCATATTLEMLVGFRVLQGLGGGMLMPLGMTILTRAAGPERVARVMAIMGVPMLLAPVFGPIVGGWLIDFASWHWIFLVNVPVGLAALVYAALVLPRERVRSSETLDIVGLLLLSPGLACLLFGVSMIPEQGTVLAAKVIAPALIGAALIGGFIPWALRRRNRHPLIELRLFLNRNLTAAVIAMFMFAAAFFGAILLLPLYFQQVRAEDAFHTGLLLAPQGIGAMITMPIAGTLADRIGPGKVVMSGLAIITLGMASFTQLGADTPHVRILAGLFVVGLGMGCTMMPTMAAALATLTDRNIARGSTLMNIVQQTAASTGTAVFSVVLTSRVSGISATDPAAALSQEASAFAGVFILAVVLVAACLIPASFLPRTAPRAPVDPVGEPDD